MRPGHPAPPRSAAGGDYERPRPGEKRNLKAGTGACTDFVFEGGPGRRAGASFIAGWPEIGVCVSPVPNIGVRPGFHRLSHPKTPSAVKDFRCVATGRDTLAADLLRAAALATLVACQLRPSLEPRTPTPFPKSPPTRRPTNGGGCRLLEAAPRNVRERLGFV